MKPWITLETASTPDGSPLLLQQRGEEFAIRAGGQVLMTSRRHESEELLARAALEGLGGGATVLVGGLGMGYTLRAALDRLGPPARVVVAELIPAVVDWNRSHLAKLAGRPLDDPRVSVEVGDVRERLTPSTFDAVLLDVDNGPEALTQASNSGLYGQRGLKALRSSLRPGGRLSLWSAAPLPSFLNRMRQAGFTPEMLPAGGRHVVFLGRTSP